MALPWPCLGPVPFSFLWIALGLSETWSLLPQREASSRIPSTGKATDPCADPGNSFLARKDGALLRLGEAPLLLAAVMAHSWASLLGLPVFLLVCILLWRAPFAMYGGRENSSLWRNSMLARTPVPIYYIHAIQVV